MDFLPSLTAPGTVRECTYPKMSSMVQMMAEVRLYKSNVSMVNAVHVTPFGGSQGNEGAGEPFTGHLVS